MGKDSTTSTDHSNRRSSKRKLDEDDGVDLPKQKSQETTKLRRLPASFFPKRVRHPAKSKRRSGNTQLVPQQVITSKIMSIPVRKIAMIIRKEGDTINYIRKQSGAMIHLPEASEAGDSSDDAKTINATLLGTTEAITKAENLLNALVISEAEKIEMRVPDTMVGLIIGKEGKKVDTIERLSGAHVQINPTFLTNGEKSTETSSVFISGSPDQIEAAKKLVNAIVSKNSLRNPAVPTSYSQPVFRPEASFQQQQQQIAGCGYRHMQPVYTPGALLQQQQQPAAYEDSGGMYPMQQWRIQDFRLGRGTCPLCPSSGSATAMQSSYYMSYSAEQTSCDQPYPPGVTPQQFSNGYSHFTPQYQPGAVQRVPDHTYINQSNQGYNQDYYSNQASSYGQQTHPTQAATNQQNPYGAWGYGVYDPYSYNQQISQAGYVNPQSNYSQPPVYDQTGLYPVNYTQGVNASLVNVQPRSELAATQAQGAGSNGNNGSAAQAAQYN